MSAELSIILARLRKEAVSVAGSGRTNAPQVAESLDHIVVPAEGQEKPDFLVLQLSLAQMVEDGLEQTEGLDETLVDELDEDREQLDERNAAAEELTDKLTSVQSACDGVYGRKASLRLFSQVETLPQDLFQLAKIGRRVHRRLADENYALPAPKLAAWRLEDRQSLADDLGGSVERFDRSLDGLTGERKTSENRRFVKSEAVDRLRLTVRHAAGCLAGLYGLAGFEALAAKIRPKRRRRRASDGPDDEPGAAAETTSSESSPEAVEASAVEPPTRPTLVES